MKYELIEAFLGEFFPEIDGVILFGSYIEKGDKAGDIDLILLSDRFSYSSQESFVFSNMKINTIKINCHEILNILAKHYKQANFYAIAFKEGVTLRDNNLNIQFIKRYLDNAFPNERQDIIGFGLNGIIHSISEYRGFLSQPLSRVQFFFVSTKLISLITDFFILQKEELIFQSEKLKSRFIENHFPIENSLILSLISNVYENEQIAFFTELEKIIDKYNIPREAKYSNDLILDDYSQPSLILFIGKLYGFPEIREIIKKIRAENSQIRFYIYQVDDENQEKTGCYIVFDNTTSVFAEHKQDWLGFVNSIFSSFEYSFPYNNVFCFPEIKFMGKENEKQVSELLRICIDTVYESDELLKEEILFFFIRSYQAKSQINLDDIFNYYLGKLNSRKRSSNYFQQGTEKTKVTFFDANAETEIKLLSVLSYIRDANLKVDFKVLDNAPIWLHIQVIDRVLSIFLRTDSEKLFYVKCIKETLSQYFTSRDIIN